MPFPISKLELFSTKPGVYLMKDQQSQVIYVGKAKNLRQRIKQYFSIGGDGREMIPFLIAKVESIDTIIVNSEKEALLLENNLIKEHKPKYNALLKDDKAYVALKVTNRDRWPMVQLVRYKGKPKQDGLYYGPYTSAYAARQTLDLIQKLFPLRQCSDMEFARRTRPCILYEMKRCIAPCVGKCSHEEYDHQVNRATRFLKGQDKEVLKDLYHEMEKSAENLEFERAAAILQGIRQIDKTLEEQNVDRPFGLDADALGIFREGDEVILSQLLFRDGRLMAAHQFNFARIAEDDQELLESFLIQHYQKLDQLPKEILLPIPLNNTPTLEEILGTDRQRKVYISTPQRGEKKVFVQMAYTNAEALFRKEKDVQAIRERTLLEMQERFNLTNYPERIECFDNSNISGTGLVSSMVAFTDGAKDSKRYRKYKIRTVDQQDDYAAMREVLMRRYVRAKEENDLPDLILVDGGKGHLNIALKVLAELNIITVDVIGIAKEEGRHDKGTSLEQIFLPNIKDPILLKKNSPVLFLLQQIRDEAHRFAITFQRNLRSKKTIKSALEDIPGIGLAKRNLLLKHFGSVKALKEAAPEELAQVKGITKANVEAILQYFKTT